MPSYASVILAETSLVSYWKLDEVSGVTAADSRGSNPGLYVGSPALGQAPPGNLMAGGAFFNGTTDCVEVATSPALHPTAALSLEVWADLSVLPGANKTIAGTGFSSNANPWVNYSVGVLSDNRLRCDLAVGTTQTTLAAVPTSINNWYHIVLTYDGTAMRFYAQGVEVSSAPLTGTVRNDSQPFELARYSRGGSTGEYFRGLLSNAAVYNAALTAGQVRNHYLAADTATAPGPLPWLRPAPAPARAAGAVPPRPAPGRGPALAGGGPDILAWLPPAPAAAPGVRPGQPRVFPGPAPALAGVGPGALPWLGRPPAPAVRAAPVALPASGWRPWFGAAGGPLSWAARRAAAPPGRRPVTPPAAAGWRPELAASFAPAVRHALVRFWRGPEARMPRLEDGEPAWATDTKSLWMGSAAGNVRIGP